jgi:hypothetical protein
MAQRTQKVMSEVVNIPVGPNRSVQKVNRYGPWSTLGVDVVTAKSDAVRYEARGYTNGELLKHTWSHTVIEEQIVAAKSSNYGVSITHERMIAKSVH